MTTPKNPLNKTQTAVALNLLSIITTYGDRASSDPMFYSTVYRTGTALGLAGSKMGWFLFMAGVEGSPVRSTQG